jgi:cytidylate kinase
MSSSAVIAVDGTAASGKGTLARKLADHFRFAHLDSGSLYRLVALAVIDANGDPAREDNAVTAAQAVDVSRRDDPRIRTAEIGHAASLVSVFPAVRAALLEFQRNFANDPPGGKKGAVIDGRDIGTVICPEADAKLFVDARPEIRAHRRWLELKERGEPASEADLLNEIKERDVRDSTRAASPLKAAPDALLLDTSDLDIDAAFAAALALVQPKIDEALKARAKG